MKRIMLIPILALTGCYDPGGSLAQREVQIQKEAKEHTPVRLPFNCDSACAEQLIDPDVCVPKYGSLAVHAANVGGIPNESATQFVFAHYANYPAFQARIRADHAMATLVLHKYTYSQMRGFGVPQCK